MKSKFLLFFLSFLLSGCSLHSLKKEQFFKYIEKAEERFAYADYKGTLAALNSSLSVYPDNPWVLEQIGWIYLDLYETGKARIYFEKSLKSDENYFAATLGLWATDLKQIGDEEIPQIEKKADFLRQKYPQNSDAQLTAYKTYKLINNYEKAFALIPHILKITDDREIVRFLSLNYIETLLREPDEEKREKGLLSYLEIFPLTKERALAYGSLLSIYSKKKKKKTDKLISISSRWLSERDNNRKANYLVSYFYSLANINLPESLTLISKAIKLIENPDPFDRPDFYPVQKWKKDLIQSKGRYYDLLGWLYLKKGDTEKALKYFDKSLELYPENPELHYHFGKLKEKEKDIKGAYRSYIQSISYGEEVEDINKRLKKLFKNLSLSNKKSVREHTADEMGITYFKEATNKLGLKNIQGTKVAWGDFNNDGFDDLLVDGHILLENQGGKGFKNITEQVGLANYSFANGGVWADFNNDGFLDFFMLGSKTSPGRFMKNRGGTLFEELKGQPFSANLLSNGGAAWGDFNNDGLLDIYVSNDEGDSTFLDRKCLPDILLINKGGKFEDLSEQFGLSKSENMCGRGVSTGDYNNDGKMDIFVSNYRLNPNFLWTNSGTSFINDASKVGVEGNMVKDMFEWEKPEKKKKQNYLSGMLAQGLFGNTIASVWGDFDNDGDPDLFSANLAHPRFIGYSNTSMLFKNENGSFVDITEDTGIQYNETDADPNFVDYDNDGFLDLFITSVYAGRKNRLFKGNGKKFSNISWASGLMTEDGWGNAFADYDNDGDLDLVVGSTSRLRFFENTGNKNNWLQVKLVGTKSNASAIGGKVMVSSEKMNQILYVKGGTGLSSQNSFTLSFGLNEFSKQVDVTATFPSGKKIYRKDIKPNQKISITE